MEDFFLTTICSHPTCWFPGKFPFDSPASLSGHQMPLCSPWRHLKSKLWQKVWPTKKNFPILSLLSSSYFPSEFSTFCSITFFVNHSALSFLSPTSCLRLLHVWQNPGQAEENYVSGRFYYTILYLCSPYTTLFGCETTTETESGTPILADVIWC